ncbi:hypothetical protein [Streptomyces echinatus]|uniref:hypothetical protein n=1 Tax=Streptomyces echinatus TaxID=67293 RepID=UPI0031F0D3C3
MLALGQGNSVPGWVSPPPVEGAAGQLGEFAVQLLRSDLGDGRLQAGLAGGENPLAGYVVVLTKTVRKRLVAGR